MLKIFRPKKIPEIGLCKFGYEPSFSMQCVTMVIVSGVVNFPAVSGSRVLIRETEEARQAWSLRRRKRGVKFWSRDFSCFGHRTGFRRRRILRCWRRSQQWRHFHSAETNSRSSASALPNPYPEECPCSSTSPRPCTGPTSLSHPRPSACPCTCR